MKKLILFTILSLIWTAQASPAPSQNLSTDVGHCIGFMAMTKELNQHRPETQERIRTMENVLLRMSDAKKSQLNEDEIKRAVNEYTTGIVGVLKEGEISEAGLSEDFKQKVQRWVDVGVNACIRAGSP